MARSRGLGGRGRAEEERREVESGLMALSPQFLDELRGRVGLVDVIARRVKLQRKGREHLGLCPFHSEKTPSFTVSEDKGFFHCFGCGAHGDVIGFVMRSEHLSFPEAVERLAAQAGLAVPQSSPAERAKAERRKTLASALEAACAFYEKQLRAPAGREALDYLHRRGLDDVTIARFRLGWAPQGSALKSQLAREGYAEAMLVEAGLLGHSEERDETFDYFRGRVMFPISDARGRIVAFGGRVLDDAKPKYINSREGELFHKGRMLYGLAHARRAAREGGELVVVEGYMDVIALHQAGFNFAVAPLGTALTEAQLDELWRLVEEPILCFDGDAAGERAAARTVERALPLLKPGKSLRFVRLPAGEDPDSLVRHRGAEAMRDLFARARPLIDLVWEGLAAARDGKTPERRAWLRREIERTAGRVKDLAIRKDYDRMLRDRYWQAFGSRGVKGGSAPGPDSGLASPGNVEVLLDRQFQGLVATLVNHPALLDELGELLVTLDLPSRDLERLRQAILETWAPDIDSETLKNHLRTLGCGAALDRVLSEDVYVAAPFAGPGRAPDVVAREWRHSYHLLLERRTRRDQDEAERAHAEGMSEQTRARFEALRRQRDSDMKHAMDLDRDDLGLPER